MSSIFPWWVYILDHFVLQITSYSSQEEEYLTLKVTDSGHGMPIVLFTYYKCYDQLKEFIIYVLPFKWKGTKYRRSKRNPLNMNHT